MKWWLALAAVSLVVLILLLAVHFASARDLGQWENRDPQIREWFQNLTQPGTNASCCGEADSYYCSEHAKGDQVYCVIDDERDDIKLRRTPVPIGTVIDIPASRINKDPNLVGRAIVFLAANRSVYCFIGAGGS